MIKRRFWAIAACLPALPVWANEAALLRCRAIADPMQRFACYEAIPLPSAPAAAPAGNADRQAAKETPKPLPRPGAPAAAPAGNGGAIAGFGLPERPPEVVRIESTVGKFQGWEPNTRIRLANGQVWQIVDDSSAYCNCDNRKVAVRRGALGAFYLEIEGSNRSPRVKRVE